MKQLFLSALMLIIGTTIWAQQGDMEISTMRIGPFKIHMTSGEAEILAGKKMAVPTEKNEYNGTTMVKYNNELIEVNLSDWYGDGTDNSKPKYEIHSLSTQSPKFRTKSGMGIGSTREQLIDTYRNFSSFEVYPGWTDEGKPSKTESYFVLNDVEAQTQISFKMRNNIVVEVTVSIIYEGC